MKIEIKKVFLFLMILFLLKPVGIESISSIINIVMNIFKLISMVFITILYLIAISKNKIKINIYISIIFFIEIITIICCIINSTSFYNALVFWHSILCFIFLFELNKKEYKDFIKIFMYAIGLYIIINFIHILFNYSSIKNNLNANYILGKKNMLVLYIFPYLYILLFYNILNSKKLNLVSISMIAICIISIYFSESSTSIVACCILVLYYLFSNFRIFKKIINLIKAKTILIIMLLFFLLIVVFQIQNNFSYFIVNVLGKDLTFTGRTFIWNRAIELIIENPIGYGWNETIKDVPSILSYIEYSEIGHAHNFILNLAFKSGVFAAFLYLIYLILISNKIDNMNNCKIKNIMKIGFAIYLILFTFESYPTNCICIIFITYLITQSDLLIGEGKEQ